MTRCQGEGWQRPMRAPHPARPCPAPSRSWRARVLLEVEGSGGGWGEWSEEKCGAKLFILTPFSHA